MAESEMVELLAKAKARWEAMTQAEQEAMIKAQRESWVRAEMSWPKPKYHWKGNTKVYDSFEDYCNDYP